MMRLPLGSHSLAAGLLCIAAGVYLFCRADNTVLIIASFVFLVSGIVLGGSGLMWIVWYWKEKI